MAAITFFTASFRFSSFGESSSSWSSAISPVCVIVVFLDETQAIMKLGYTFFCRRKIFRVRHLRLEELKLIEERFFFCCFVIITTDYVI